MKCSFWNSATKVAKKTFLILLAITLAFSINLVKPVEVQAAPCWYHIWMEATPLPSGCGAHIEVSNITCHRSPTAVSDNAVITVYDQNNVITYRRVFNLLDFYPLDSVFSLEFDVNAVPQQTEMRIMWEYAFQPQWGAQCIRKDTVQISCCNAVPSNNWLTFDTFPIPAPGNATYIWPKLSIPNNTDCITHYTLKRFQYNNFTIDSTLLGLTPLPVPNTSGVREVPLYIATLYPGDVLDYEIFLICNTDMPANYRTSNAYPIHDTSYTVYISKYQQYKQSAGEEFLNDVEAIHYDNTLTINTSLSPDFAQALILHIYNSAGETVATETYNLSTGNSFKYDVTHLQKGAYYFSITTDSGNPIFNNKFMVIE